MSHTRIYLNNDNVVTLSGLKDTVTDSFVNDADVVVTIQDSDGDDVSGISWPQTMSYIAASNGDYQVTIDKALVLVANSDYTAIIIVSGSGIADGEWQIALRASIRTS